MGVLSPPQKNEIKHQKSLKGGLVQMGELLKNLVIIIKIIVK